MLDHSQFPETNNKGSQGSNLAQEVYIYISITFVKMEYVGSGAPITKKLPIPITDPIFDFFQNRYRLPIRFSDFPIFLAIIFPEAPRTQL